jgi:hypothetical protein
LCEGRPRGRPSSFPRGLVVALVLEVVDAFLELVHAGRDGVALAAVVLLVELRHALVERVEVVLELLEGLRIGRVVDLLLE